MAGRAQRDDAKADRQDQLHPPQRQAAAPGCCRPSRLALHELPGRHAQHRRHGDGGHSRQPAHRCQRPAAQEGLQRGQRRAGGSRAPRPPPRASRPPASGAAGMRRWPECRCATGAAPPRPAAAATMAPSASASRAFSPWRQLMPGLSPAATGFKSGRRSCRRARDSPAPVPGRGRTDRQAPCGRGSSDRPPRPARATRPRARACPDRP